MVINIKFAYLIQISHEVLKPDCPTLWPNINIGYPLDSEFQYRSRKNGQFQHRTE